MGQKLSLAAQKRSDMGKGASRRLRRLQNLVPGIIYGSDKEPTPISVALKDLVKQLENEAFYSNILSLEVDGVAEEVVLKDLQRHPAKERPLHVDFLRVDDSHTIKMQVPIHFINENACVGVKIGGGLIDHQMNEVEIQCLPKDLPEYLEVDMANVNLGESVHLSDLNMPEGVTIVALLQGADHDHTIAMVQASRATIEADEDSSSSEEGGDS